jgi:hypothetical protein
MYDEEKAIRDAEKLLKIIDMKNLLIRTYRKKAKTDLCFTVNTISGSEIYLLWRPGTLSTEVQVKVDGLDAAYISVKKGKISDDIMDALLRITSAADDYGREMFNALAEEVS